MKNIVLLFFLAQGILSLALGQDKYRITYQSFYNGQISKQEPIVVYASPDYSAITKESILSGEQKFPHEYYFIDQQAKLFYKETALSKDKKIAAVDSNVFGKYVYNQTRETKLILGHSARKASLSVNSNAIEIWYTNELNVYGAPNETGLPLGLVLEYMRNGSSSLVATKIEKVDTFPSSVQPPEARYLLDELTYRDILWKSRFIQVPIFKDELISFNPEQVKSDSILRFAEGTVIVKKVKIPEVAGNSQVFIELIEKSNGDAYDRTGSVFLIADDQELTFLDGMKNGMTTLPRYDNGDGNNYLGMIRTDKFSPVYELMRFFTPFGVSHFNDRLTLKGKTWQDSVIYRQEISEFLKVLTGKEVYIGTYIGNYDKGGHKVSLELTIHSGNSSYAKGKSSIALFNTTNVMEMGGQTYATLFGLEKGLQFTFDIPKDIENVQLRYITTGHGGWGNGDEFVPKVNSIYLNGRLSFQFTPWRLDCGGYRLYNPVSGNFENGLSSSDLSRSNWCPGTVTNPIFINLGNLKAGKHTIRIHIPQGPREGDSMSFWNVSGALIY
ncbi:peptide-N-glycosidase [Sphingobacterium olei]|uniref:Peptide-N-glycosidase n=1 Tax=Sphingobacterium olei TaxID=2571155 RepID=A0A4U0NDB5_9SPHI|nr:PNGase F N-terminal domain-containing protein [Sphingobacterium olei]TJZ51783.1 peptide-N-glycosidase [Sphingobacterium olei]